MSAFIHASNLTLEVPYYVQPDRVDTSWFRTLVGAATRRPQRHFARLIDDVSFQIEEGDRIALIGQNGAGKTTLLRILTGAFRPTHGAVSMQGSRQALLNLSLGFNPEATLIENIFLRATAMGMQASTVRGLIPAILDFAELERLTNRRLATLSSGQKMRLGFAISTAVQHDIMLLDEWVGAGDAAFVQKARERLIDRVKGAKIVVVASHNDALTRQLCNRGLVMQDGKAAYLGSIKDALFFYKKMVEREKSLRRRAERAASKAAEQALNEKTQ